MRLELNNVSYSYHVSGFSSVQAVSGVNLCINSSESVGIMGKTGSGKSTLIQLAAGLLKPSCGSVLLDGKDVGAASTKKILRESVGVVFQFPDYQLFESTVEKDVSFGLRQCGFSAEKIRSGTAQALELMGFSFEKIGFQSPLALSGGEKRRVAIAGVLAAQPRILIFDEPFAGLDPLARESFVQLVRNLHAEGKTVIIVSHNADALSETVERIIVLEAGKIADDGSAQKILADIPRMSELHLGVSTPSHIVSLLHERGVDLPQSVTYAQLLGALTKKFGDSI